MMNEIHEINKISLNSYVSKVILLSIFIFSSYYTYAQNTESKVLQKLFASQKISYVYGHSRDHVQYVNYTTVSSNEIFSDVSWVINYNLHFKKHIELLSSIAYSYENRSSIYQDFYMDNYGTSEIHYKAHLMSLDIGAKFFIPRNWNRLYLRISASVVFSINRRNDFYIPGQYHYQEFTGLKFSGLSGLFFS